MHIVVRNYYYVCYGFVILPTYIGEEDLFFSEVVPRLQDAGVCRQDYSQARCAIVWDWLNTRQSLSTIRSNEMI